MEMTTYERIRALILARMPVEGWQVTPTARLWADLEMDDLELAGFRNELEEAFELSIASEDLLGDLTVADLVALIESRRVAG